MIELYSANTPNGIKVSIALEELGLSYRLIKLDLASGEQKQPAFLQINPNGRIPAIVDTQGPGGLPLSVFESGAILLYLAEKAPGLLPLDPVERQRALEYLFFQVGGIGPIFGQAGWFLRSAGQPMPAAIERFCSEALRLTGVLETRLTAQPWLAGSSYSIADIMNFAWLRSAEYAGVDLSRFPAVTAWLQRIAARPAVQRGLAALQ
jgi:GSH-dependent disulfide-bond oxidoreductase